MAHDDPFTLDLFGNIALSPGLGLGITAFPILSDDDPDNDDDLPPTVPAPARPIVASERPARPVRRNGAPIDAMPASFCPTRSIPPCRRSSTS